MTEDPAGAELVPGAVNVAMAHANGFWMVWHVG